MSVHLSTFENLMHECADVVRDQSGVENVTSETHEIGDNIEGWIIARATLRAVYPFSVDRLALKHAQDVDAFVRELVEPHKDFAVILRRANEAATTAWQQEIERR